MRASGFVLAAALCGGFTTAAGAADSTYTSMDLADCKEQPTNPEDPLETGVWSCEGYGGVPVWISEGDLRLFVSFGPKPQDEPAAAQTMVRFNHLGDTLEWRLDGPPPDGRPYAAIVRYFVGGDGEAERQILAVIRLGEPGSICHVARVDATANADANELARQAADEQARSFRCGTEPVVIGDPGVLGP